MVHAPPPLAILARGLQRPARLRHQATGSQPPAGLLQSARENLRRPLGFLGRRSAGRVRRPLLSCDQTRSTRRRNLLRGWRHHSGGAQRTASRAVAATVGAATVTENVDSEVKGLYPVLYSVDHPPARKWAEGCPWAVHRNLPTTCDMQYDDLAQQLPAHKFRFELSIRGGGLRVISDLNS